MIKLHKFYEEFKKDKIDLMYEEQLMYDKIMNEYDEFKTHKSESKPAKINPPIYHSYLESPISTKVHDSRPIKNLDINPI